MTETEEVLKRKKREARNRVRYHTVAFRMDGSEWAAFLERVELSGHQRQDYLIKSALHQEIVVIGNGALFKKLDSAVERFIVELQQMDASSSDASIPTIRVKTLLEILSSLRDGGHGGNLDDYIRECVLSY